LLSALLHIIYNPSEAEFREWIQAAERETWKFIPAIKSHIAEEITLDRCVQRLRKRIVQESWEKHRRESVENIAHTVNGKLEGRVPSFFTSQSLVNLSGLGVADQPATEDLHEYAHGVQSPPPGSLVPEVGLNSGWGGMGLRGNRSTGNLQRTPSDASGLFIDEEEHSKQQDAGENTTTETKPSASSLSTIKQGELAFKNDKGYVKTTSMAKFYYRKSASNDPSEAIQKTTSDSFIDRDLSNSPDRVLLKPRHARQKSKSHADLATSMEDFVPIKET
jgi:hypothetical protein